MKRLRASTKSTGSRKSSRLEAAAYPKLFEKKYAHAASSDEDPLQINRTNRLCNKYNRMIPFAQEHPNASTCLPPLEHAVKFEKTMDEINKIIRDACRRIDTKIEQLEEHVKHFSNTTSALDRSYEGGDLLSLDMDEFDRFLKRLDSEKDMDHFIQYVNEIIEDVVREPETEEEFRARHGRFGGRPRHERTFLKKVLKLIQLMINKGRDRDAFQALVLFRSTLKTSNKRVLGHNLCETHKWLDSMIKAFTGEPLPQSGVRRTFDGRRTYDKSMPLWIEFEDGLKWRAFQKDIRSTRYWDFAAATRTFRPAYVANLCNGEDEVRVEEYDHGSQACFHHSSFDPLEWLQTKAWSEIRNSVFSTIGTILPTQLTEQIFGLVLGLEEIPSHPTLISEELVDPPEHTVEGQSKHGLEDPQSRSRRRIKPQYRCYFMDSKAQAVDEHYSESGNVFG